MNLYLILHTFFQRIFLDFLVSIFISSPKLEEFRIWTAEKGTNFCNKKVLVSQWGGPPPTGASPPTPLDPLLPPIHPLFHLYTRPSRIGGGIFSSPCVHSLCQTLRTELHKIAYATQAYFFTPLLHNILFF